MTSNGAQNRGDSQDDDRSTQSQSDPAKIRDARRTLEHGIRATEPVVARFEKRDDWLEHRDTVVGELNPVGKLETAYAERAANYLWRLDRVTRYEITATEFDLEDLIQEFIHSLDHPELPRDRSEAVTIEKIRKDLRDYLDEFKRLGAKAAKLPELQDGLDRVRKEVKRVRERRILPDQPTIQTIIKYEGHLQRCLARTMTELRRLQKERRQGLREIVDEFTDRYVEHTGGAPAPIESTKPVPANESIREHQDENTGEAPSSADLMNPKPADLMNSKPADDAKLQSPDRFRSVDQPIQNPTTVDSCDVESTRNGIITQRQNSLSALIAMFPKADHSALVDGVVQSGPIALETLLHQKE